MMNQENENPAADVTADGAKNVAEHNGGQPTTLGDRPHPHGLALRRCPERPDYWLVAIDDLTEFPVRKDRFLRWRRFRNVARHQLGFMLPEEKPANWRGLVEAAVARVEGDAS